MFSAPDRFLLNSLPLTMDALPLADALFVHLRAVHAARNQLGADGLSRWARAITAISKAQKAILALQNAKPQPRASRRAHAARYEAQPDAELDVGPENQTANEPEDPAENHAPAENEALVAEIEAKLDRFLANHRRETQAFKNDQTKGTLAAPIRPHRLDSG
jgi:hypothetical protein